MAFSKTFYFAALVPPPAVKEEVLEMKLEIKEKFDAKHALKLPAHITLIPPIWLEKKQEKDFTAILRNVAQQQSVFSVKLKDFGHFGQRVIFINVVDHEPVQQLYASLKKSLSDFLSNEKDQKMHPHVTLATRDLNREKFGEAWKEYRDRSYSNEFQARAITLFRHDGKKWEVCPEFQFSK